MKNILVILALALASCMPYGVPTMPEKGNTAVDAEVGYGERDSTAASDSTGLPRDTLRIEIIVNVTGGRP